MPVLESLSPNAPYPGALQPIFGTNPPPAEAYVGDLLLDHMTRQSQARTYEALRGHPRIDHGPVIEWLKA